MVEENQSCLRISGMCNLSQVVVYYYKVGWFVFEIFAEEADALKEDRETLMHILYI